MKHQWLAYVIVALLSIGAGVAIAGLPDNVSVDATVIPTTTTDAREPTVPETTGPTTTEPETTEPDTGQPGIVSAFYGLDSALPGALRFFIHKNAGGKDGMPVNYQTGKVTAPELYDLKSDISETTNVADLQHDGHGQNLTNTRNCQQTIKCLAQL